MKTVKASLIGFLLVAAMGSSRAADLRVGQAFPKLSFPSAETGAPMSIDDFRGEKLVVHLFASW